MSESKAVMESERAERIREIRARLTNPFVMMGDIDTMKWLLSELEAEQDGAAIISGYLRAADSELTALKSDIASCVANSSDLAAENNADRDMKGRARGGSRPGEKHHAAKLTDDQINEIRKATGLQREIAERFGVSQQSVSMIRNRKTWNHIT